jgi:hypothetical protein
VIQNFISLKTRHEYAESVLDERRWAVAAAPAMAGIPLQIRSLPGSVD